MSTQTGTRDSLEGLFYPVLATLLVLALWFLLKTPFLNLSFYCSFYMFGFYENLTWLLSSTELATIKAARRSIPSINVADHGIASLFTLMEIHGYILRWLAIPFMLWLGWRTKTKVVRFRYRRHIKNVYDLINIQAKHFPASAIIKGKNLLAMHPKVGPWATYEMPLDFALDNKLLWTSTQRVGEHDRVDETKMMAIPPFTPNEKLLHFRDKRKMLPSHRYVLLSLERANTLFGKQCGELWQGSNTLPPLEKALYAAFCAQACGEQAEAWKMIEQLGFTFKEGKRNDKGVLTTPHYANTKGTDDLLSRYGNNKEVVAITKMHAHKYNVIWATLALARKKGRLTHANFLWLKPVNRTLWYALCGQGGQVPYWEAAGLWAHAQVELRMGRKIPKPMVAGAVDAMYQTMSREHWIDPGEYSEEYQQRLVTEANELLSQQSEKASRKRTGPGQQSMLGSSFAAPSQRRPLNENDEP